MSKIGDDEVKRLAKLAKIGLSDEEASRLAGELDQIVEFVTQLERVDTGEVEETSQVTGLTDVWRMDNLQSAPGQDELLKVVPKTRDGYIEVPKVL